MSYASHPYVAMAADVEEAYEIVRNPVRLQIAVHLIKHPDSRIGEVVEAVGGQRHTIRTHLVELERIGVVTTSHDFGQRSGRRVTYSLDLARWNELYDRLRAFLVRAVEEAQRSPLEGNQQ